MNTHQITTLKDYKAAVIRSIEIFHAPEGTPEYKELSQLLARIKGYEDKNIIPPNNDE